MDYQRAGVNIQAGDEASRKAYANAKTTFSSRKGNIGEPFEQEGGFAGALDMGNFLLVQNDDGVGTKAEIAERLKKFDTLGEDLVAMLADDGVCLGAEIISLTNTFDVSHVDPEIIDQLTQGLAKACQAQAIVIPGGEVAEVGEAVNRLVWNGTTVGIVKKENLITGKTIEPGQKIIGLRGRVLRSNGFTLARKICEEHFGPDWHNAEYEKGQTWGEVLLTPSKIFHRLLIEQVLGDFQGERRFEVHGIVHITGGGIPGNLPRIFPQNRIGAHLENLHPPHEALKRLVELGQVSEENAYRTWHCGTALMLIVDEQDAEAICETLNQHDKEVDAQVIGDINTSGTLDLISQFSTTPLTFPR